MLFALGMGGFDRPLPQMLTAVGWSLCAVPFYVRINHPARVLRQVTPLRRGRGRRLLADVAAGTGVGWLGIKAVQLARTRSAARGVSVEEVKGFGDWADDLWQRSRARYTMIGSRDSATLNVLYPSWGSFICVKVTRGAQVLGWAVALDTQMRGSRYFGDMRVGSLVDCLARPEEAPAIVQSVTRLLEARGVDLVLSNQSHAAWRDALKSAGFLGAPSNFIFGASKSVAELTGALRWQSGSHLPQSRRRRRPGEPVTPKKHGLTPCLPSPAGSATLTEQRFIQLSEGRPWIVRSLTISWRARTASSGCARGRWRSSRPSRDSRRSPIS
jgi:hypothetical protein